MIRTRSATPLADVPPAPSKPHERIVDAARELFCRDGIHATGIDRVLDQARASKMTLYTRFGSKEALVRAVLTQEGEEWRAAFMSAVARSSDDPQAQLSHVVQALSVWFDGGRFYGCAFMNAIAEHTKGEAWLRQLASAHQEALLTFLMGIASRAGIAEADLAARQVLLLMDGAIAALMVSGNRSVIPVASRSLDAILTSHHVSTPRPLS